jgi:hypothetical protein
VREIARLSGERVPGHREVQGPPPRLRLCAGMTPGGGRIKKYMTDNAAKLLSVRGKKALGVAGTSN